jgi:outer membrane protein assembly factor BamA
MALRLSVQHYVLYVFAVAPIVCAADLTPPAEYEGKAVVHVRFEPASQPLKADDLNRLVAFSEGVPLHLADVRAAIKRLFGTGSYSNIEVDTEPAPGGLNLVFRTTTQWFVGPVEVTGKIHLPPNTAQLTSSTRLDLGTPFNDGDVDTAVSNLRTLLERNGLYHGTITPSVVRDSEHQQVSITFRVNSGKRARFTRPTLHEPRSTRKSSSFRGSRPRRRRLRPVCKTYATGMKSRTVLRHRLRWNAPTTSQIRTGFAPQFGPMAVRRSKSTPRAQRFPKELCRGTFRYLTKRL